MEQESQNYISFMEALEASKEIDEYYASGEYANDMKALREILKQLKSHYPFTKLFVKLRNSTWREKMDFSLQCK